MHLDTIMCTVFCYHIWIKLKLLSYTHIYIYYLAEYMELRLRFILTYHGKENTNASGVVSKWNLTRCLHERFWLG